MRWLKGLWTGYVPGRDVNEPLGGGLKIMIRAIRRAIVVYLAGVGLLAHFALVIGFVLALNYFHLTASQFLVKAADKSGLDIPWLVEAISPAQRHAEHVLDGTLRPTHPRTILPELAQWEGGVPPLMQRRVALYEQQSITDFDPCKTGGDMLNLAACWVSSGESAVAEQLLAVMKGFQLQTPDVMANYGNGWELAFAYDLVLPYSGLDADERAQIESKIEFALRDYLTLLDDSSPSLWHGRTSLASMAWLCAVVLDPQGSRERPALIARAQGHFLDVVRAAEITEGWPEGYNYWIQNRGLIFTLAASAYLNGLDDARNQNRIRLLLKRIGLWHIYATRPDHQIEGLGDEGSRVDLKDETRRVIDVIAQATRDPLFAMFSRYLEELHGNESYYREYRWGFRLFNDPTVETLPNSHQGLQRFASLLPTVDLFGRGGLNQAFIRSDWSPEATFVSFRAGHTFTHHGHYDAGHFSLFKGEPLAINSSVYGDYTGPNRLNYSIRTIAKNSLLILRPDERVQPNRFFEKNVADGGQRVVIPTGSAVQSVSDWANNRDNGMHYSGGIIEHYDDSNSDYVYIASDLTKAYNTPEDDEGGRGGKVREVKRELVYLAKEDRLLVHDRITSTHAEYTKKWLLHTVNRPRMDGLTLLAGKADNGILESRNAAVQVVNGQSHLRVDRLYPEDAVIRLVGGQDYQYYVETDGDDSDLDGENFSQGATTKPWFDVGMWRLEIQPGKPRIEDEFLIALSPSLEVPRVDRLQRLLLTGADAKGLATDEALVVFVKSEPHGKLEISVPQQQSRLYVFGIPPSMAVQINGDDFSQSSASNSEGALAVTLDSNTQQLELSW